MLRRPPCARPQYSSWPTHQAKRLPAQALEDRCACADFWALHTPSAARCASLTIAAGTIAAGSTRPRHALTSKHSPGDLSVLTGNLYLLTQQAQVLAEPDHHGLGVSAAEGTSTASRCLSHSRHQGAEATGKPALLSLLPSPLWRQPSKNHHFSHTV